MEITNNNNGRQNTTCQVAQTRNIFIGVVFILIGIVWALNNFDLLSEKVFSVLLSWQMLLIVVGCYLLSLQRWIGGTITTAIGAMFLMVDLLNIHINIDRLILPIIFGAIGVAIILTRKQLK